MNLSHTKLNCILTCPASYYLKYIQGISLARVKPALAIGSAVHWGIEHNIEDLSEYYGEGHAYGRDEWLSESMVHGYLKHKDEIFEQILTDTNGKKMELLSEEHELRLTTKLKSIRFENHDFLGIIDLLLLTDKGFVVVDYKTSTYAPDWDAYLEQIYRYVYLLRQEFPEMPVVKIGVINLRKTSIKQKKSETDEQFINRLKFEYDLNDENLINYHEFLPEDLNEQLLNGYINNLSLMADMAQVIDESKCWFINFGAANGQYGKSDYWDIFYHTLDAHYLYKIRDTILSIENGEVVKQTSRDCLPIDMTVLDNNKVLNHYEQYLDFVKLHPDEDIHDYYIVDDMLLEVYKKNLEIEQKHSN